MLTVHLYFGRKDGDLIQWKNCLPPRKLSRFIVAALEAEINQRFCENFPVPETAEAAYIPDTPYDCAVHIKNVVVEQYLRALPEFHRNDVVKQVLRKNMIAAMIGRGKNNSVIPALSTASSVSPPRKNSASAPKIKKAQKKKQVVTLSPEAVAPPVQNQKHEPIYTEKENHGPANKTSEKTDGKKDALKNALLALAGD